MNIYRFNFEVDCPNNDQRIAYQVEIQADQTANDIHSHLGGDL